MTSDDYRAGVRAGFRLGADAERRRLVEYLRRSLPTPVETKQGEGRVWRLLPGELAREGMLRVIERMAPTPCPGLGEQT